MTFTFRPHHFFPESSPSALVADYICGTVTVRAVPSTLHFSRVVHRYQSDIALFWLRPQLRTNGSIDYLDQSPDILSFKLQILVQ